MGTRFDSAARKAIDFAMIEVERRGGRALDPSHLLLGLLQPTAGAIADALDRAGVEIGRLRATATASLGAAGTSHDERIDVAHATEQILQRSSELSAARGGDVVTDLDILIAAAERSETAAGQLLAAHALTAAALEALVILPAAAAGRPGAAGVQAGAERASRTAPAPSGTAPAGRAEPLHGTSPGRLTTRTGVGYDSHRFGPGGPLVLGGVRIEADVHLAGHSDGDAIAHALTDAVLGAAGGGDIGEMFADTDPANRGRDSIDMLRLAVERAAGLGWAVEHADIVVVAETPKIGPHRAAMRERLAPALRIPADAVSVKGKTNEGMGWIGRGEGIACIAVATLSRTAPRP